MNIVSGIYCIENIVNQKKYIGQSIDVNRRLSAHIRMLKNNNHDNEYLQRAYNKYGKDVFSYYLIKACKPKYLNRFEKLYIRVYDTYINGYNLSKGGDIAPTFAGLTHTNMTKQKMSQIKKEQYIGKNNPMYGKKHDLNSKLKVSKSLGSTGIYRVHKHKSKTCKQGFYWEYVYTDNGKTKSLSSVSINKLKEKVINLSLPWIEFNPI